MAIRFAGVDLLLEDPEGELAEWLNHHLSIDDLRMYGVQPVSRYDNSLPISYPNFSLPPLMRFNSLYWPTGASRWAFGLFLCTTTQLEAILEKIDVESPAPMSASTVVLNKPEQLVLVEPDFFSTPIKEDDFTLDPNDKVALSTSMYALPPRPITPTAYPEGLWVLPLVDVRYFWQWRHTEDFDEGAGGACGDWDDLFTGIEDVLDVDPTGLTWESVHDSYGQPNTVWVKRHLSYANAAVVFDAVSFSVGQRVARWIDGRVYSIDVTKSEEEYDHNLEGTIEEVFKKWNPLSGDEFSRKHPSAAKPEFVTVAFQTPSECDSIWNSIDEKAITHGILDYTEGLKKLIRTTSSDDFEDGSSTTENADLAAQIAKDFYGWLKKRYDRSFTSIKAWNPTGFDDFVIWDFGQRKADGSYAANTRVQSAPYNFGVEQQIQQCGTAGPCEDQCHLIRFTIISADCVMKMATVEIDANLCGCDPDEVGSTITVSDELLCLLTEPDEDLIGRRGFAANMQDNYGNCQWGILVLCCAEDVCL